MLKHIYHRSSAYLNCADKTGIYRSILKAKPIPKAYIFGRGEFIRYTYVSYTKQLQILHKPKGVARENDQ